MDAGLIAAIMSIWSGVFAAEVWAFSEGYFVVDTFFGEICFLSEIVAIA